MITQRVRRTDEEIIKWAQMYLYGNKGLIKLEEDTGVSHSTMWWCFTHRLENINHVMYASVFCKLQTNSAAKKKFKEI